MNGDVIRSDTGRLDLLELTTGIVSAHAGNNTLSPDALMQMIRDVFHTLENVGQEGAGETVRRKPAVPIKKSVFPDYIICLEDGKKLKMLKRHLKSAYRMTPEEYRARWKLDADYPMVAPNYAKHRSALAKKIGLGTKPKKAKD